MHGILVQADERDQSDYAATHQNHHSGQQDDAGRLRHRYRRANGWRSGIAAARCGNRISAEKPITQINGARATVIAGEQPRVRRTGRPELRQRRRRIVGDGNGYRRNRERMKIDLRRNWLELRGINPPPRSFRRRIMPRPNESAKFPAACLPDRPTEQPPPPVSSGPAHQTSAQSLNYAQAERRRSSRQ